MLPQIWGLVSGTLTCNPSELEVEVVFELPLPCSGLSDSGNWDWYYEQPLPEGRKNYTKTAPIQFEEFAVLIKWWGKRKETDNAWKVTAAERLANGCNLDRKNPRAKEDITHLPPEQLAADILKKEQRIAEIMGNIRILLAK